MKNILKKYNHVFAAKLLVFCFVDLCLYTFVSCNERSYSKTDTKKLSTIPALKKTIFEAPKVIPITAANRPKVIKAGKPVIKKDSSNGGVPFFTNYRIDEGLPVNNIICSATDKSGNLWFGTGGGGASRFDGKNFTNYSIAQGLSGNNVFCIMEDLNRNIWIGTTSGLSKYDGYHFTNYSTADGLASNFVTCILQDRNRNIWFGTQDGGVSKFDGNTFTNYSTSQGLADNDVHCMKQDENGNLWFGTDSGGVSKYDGSRFINYSKNQGLAGNSVNCITLDNANNLWFGTNSGASKYNGLVFTNFTTAQGLPNNTINWIIQDKDGLIWLASHSKEITKYNGEKFTNYTRTVSLTDFKVNSLIEDISGNLWITSQGGGVTKYEGNSLRNYTTAQGLAANLVFWIVQDRAGNLWFATYEGGVSKYDGYSFTNYTKDQGLADNKVWNIMQDRKGNLWFATDRGVSKFNGSSFTNYTTKQGLPSDAIITMLEDKEGNIWLGTRADGVIKFDGKTFTNYTKAQGLAGNNIWGIVQDKQGNMWFATHDGGASKYDGNGFTNYTTAQGLPGNDLSSIIQDKNGLFWFGTDAKGISRYDGKTFTSYTTEQGLADNAVWNIAEDTSRGIIWFGTTRGLSGIRENNLRSNKQENLFENINKINGYPVKDVSAGGMLVDDKGIVWMGSGEGKLIRFDYSTISKKNSRPLPLKIQSVKINNENICWSNLVRTKQGYKDVDSFTVLNEMITTFGKRLSPQSLSQMRKRFRDVKLDGVTPFYPVPVNLVLPHKYNTITIDFGAIEPALPKQVTYQYKLEGYNTDWSSPGNNSTAVFGNMQAGNYTFRVKALSPFGIWSETSYSFRVLPAWWTTWWAYSIYILLITGIGFIVNRIHIENLKRKQAEKFQMMLATQEEERKRISLDLHDDIGARLTNINLLSALGQSKINKPQQVAEYLKRISSEIQTSAESLDDIVWNIDSKNDAMEEVTARMRRYAATVFDGTVIEYTIIANENSLPEKLSIGKRRDLFFVFKEALNNIQKHAMATEVNIQIEGKQGAVFMKIKDNGKGFDTTIPTHRNGLKNIQKRMEKWGGKYSVTSSANKGSIIEINLPDLTTSLKRGRWSWFKNS